MGGGGHGGGCWAGARQAPAVGTLAPGLLGALGVHLSPITLSLWCSEDVRAQPDPFVCLGRMDTEFQRPPGWRGRRW